MAGWVMLGVAGFSALLAVELMTLDTSTQVDPAQARELADTLGEISAVAALVTAITGVALLSSGRSALRVGPTVTPSAVGLMVMLRM